MDVTRASDPLLASPGSEGISEELRRRSADPTSPEMSVRRVSDLSSPRGNPMVSQLTLDSQRTLGPKEEGGDSNPPSAMQKQLSFSGKTPLRVARSWGFYGEEANKQRKKLMVPITVNSLGGGMARSFAGAGQESDHRVFGGIEQRCKPILPSTDDTSRMRNWSYVFQRENAIKPYVVAFVNSKSGGQIGGLLMKVLSEAIRGTGEDAPVDGEVCDLSQPDEPASTIQRLARDQESQDGPDHAAGAGMPKRLLVCGGDGTVTWILTALEQCEQLQGKLHLFPVAICPLGTGNDLARSLGWGKKLKRVKDVLHYVQWVASASVVTLDQWRLVLRPHDELPHNHKLRQPGSHPQLVGDIDAQRRLIADLDEALDDDGAVVKHDDVYLGFWQNYFSLGFCGRGTNAVEISRSETGCGRFCFRQIPFGGKFCFGFQIASKASLTPLLSKKIQNMRVQRPGVADDEPFEELNPPLSEQRVNRRTGHVRSLIFQNINCFGAGMDVLPKTVREDLPKPGPADGALEVLALRNVVVAGLAQIGAARPTHLTSGRAAAFVVGDGEYMQVDGEAWGLSCPCDVLVQPHRKVTMLCAPPAASFWGGHVTPRFWDVPDKCNSQKCS